MSAGTRFTRPKEIRRLVGYMPDFFGVYDDMRVIEYLEFFAAAYRIRGPAPPPRCNEMLEIVDLDFKRDAYANTLSRGQTQRLGLAASCCTIPRCCCLDEPLSGWIPERGSRCATCCAAGREMGKTIIVSSHILPELADICNKIGIIDRGVIEVNAEVSEVMKRVRQRTVINIGLDNPENGAVELLRQHPLVESVEPGDGKLMVTLTEQAQDYSELNTLLVQNGHHVRYFGEEEVNLEAAFMALTKGMGQKI
jgi:ABC-2 type transport system ATP-binding protein